MANLKISQLAALAEADVTASDVLAVADISASETKKVTAADTVKAGARLNTGTVTFGGNVAITGNLNVNGTTTTIDTQNLLVEDKNIELGVVGTPTDVTADGGGILLQGTTPKLFAWANATDSWTSSENVDLGSGKSYRINGTEVLSGTTLGSGVVSSSLTSLGTVTTGTWSASTIAVDKGGTGQTSYTNGQLLIGNSTGNTLTKSTLTAGSGVTITNGNGSITISATGAGGTITAVTATSPLASSGGTTPDISIQDGTTSQKGAVQLEDSTSSTSTTKAATPNSVKSAYDLANAALPKAGGTMTGSITFAAGQTTATTTTPSIVQLEDSTSSTSTTTAATPNAVKTAYDLANAALPKAGGTLTGDVTLNAQSDLRFADSDSSNWVAFQAPATVASNVTWTLPSTDGSNGQTLSTNGSGVLSWANSAAGDVTLNGVQTLTNKTLTDPAIIGTVLEDVYTISDGAAFEIDPGNGSIQLITLGANRTPKATNFAAGEAVTLMVDDGSAYTLTWSDSTFGGSGVVWKTGGGNAPTLNTTGYTVITLWKVGTQVYGARVGDA
jgi:hypothetical protein